MDFKDQIKEIANRVINLKTQIQTEEATKNAFIMPFIKALGYDVFNPTEVIPEYISDIGIKKGEKIDYAIIRDGAPIILVECKHWQQNLNLHDGQLLRYFHVSKAKFGLLTNGIIYRFYTDLEELNKMDEKPFLEFDITHTKEEQLEELKKFHKSYFDVSNIMNSAEELKYSNELRSLIEQEFKNPSEQFVRFFARNVHKSVVTAKVLEQFTNLLKKTTTQYINDLITERLKTAINSHNKQGEQVANSNDVQPNATTDANAETADSLKKIETTQEELESFYIIKSILRQKIDPARIYMRDNQNYCAIILDDNNRKTICRLYFTATKKFVIFFDENKKEVRANIETINDIYNLTDKFDSAINIIDKVGVNVASVA
jgi:hypothetical protein